MNKDLLYWVWISRLENVKLKTIHKLLKKYKIDEIPKLTNSQLINENIEEKEIYSILNKKYRLGLDKYIKYMQQNDIKLISIKEREYPAKLKVIENPPIWLYIKGNSNILNEFSLAIVGCRKCSIYGEKISEEFAYKLSKKNINIVSGLAKGIDSKAHIGCLKAKGKTIAVLGCGLDIIYPKENLELAKNIMKNNGTIISEYIIGTKPNKENFPRRNRIISGLSNGIIVVEATRSSGSLITAEYGINQGKEIFAVPGNITSEKSVGTNELIQDGAKITINIADILEEY